MKISEAIQKVKSSKFTVLVYTQPTGEKKSMGMRLRFFDVDYERWELYDFELNTSNVPEQEHRDFIMGINKGLERQQLIPVEGGFCTQDEIDGEVKVRHFTELEPGHRKAMLDVMMRVYGWGAEKKQAQTASKLASLRGMYKPTEEEV